MAARPNGSGSRAPNKAPTPTQASVNGLSLAEMAELLTPFLSPSATPLGLAPNANAPVNVFSPLTSPALLPSGSMAMGSHHLAAQDMLPPSSSVTEQIMRRQQQYQQQAGMHAPSLPTAAAWGAGAGARSRRGNGATGASPHHHPYRTPGSSRKQQPSPNDITLSQQQHQQHQQHARMAEHVFSPMVSADVSTGLPISAGSMEGDGFLLDALGEPSSSAMAMIASLHNTPSLAAASTMAAEFAGLHLPDAVVDSRLVATGGERGQHNAAAERSRTLHQLNSPRPQWASVSADAPSSQALLGSASQHVSEMAAWLGHQASGSRQNSAGAGGSSMMATPAMLMNLPVSAHHLPHTSTGEIVAGLVSAARDLPPTVVSTPSPVEESAPRRRVPAGAQSAPMPDFVHPPVPPPLRIGPPSVTNAALQHGAAAVVASGSGQATTGRGQKSVASPESGPMRPRRGEASRARRRSRAALLLSPRATPLVPSILKGTSPMVSPATGPLSQTPSLGPQTPAIAPRQQQQQPQQQPKSQPETQPPGPTITATLRTSIVAATSTTNILGLESDVVKRLATKSNYQNIMEGNSEMLGLKYHTEFKSGLEKRRTNHKQAEQKRRDSLKVCFQDLRDRLPNVDPKLASKIYLLRMAGDHIDEMNKVNEALLAAARDNGIDADAIVASVRKQHRESAISAMDEDAIDDDMDSS